MVCQGAAGPSTTGAKDGLQAYFYHPKAWTTKVGGGEKENLEFKFFGIKKFNQHLLSTMSQVQDWIPEGWWRA